jgi:hypothetical protein
MKLINISTILIAAVLSFTASAEVKNISVQIDGKTYNCSGDGQATGSCVNDKEAFAALLKSCTVGWGPMPCVQKHWPI